MNTVRWILVVPSAVLAWLAVFFAGIFCAEALGTGSGLAFEVLVVVFAGISAMLVVSASVLVAPAGKDTVAIVSFVLGSAVAAGFLVESDYELWRVFVSAILAGAAACRFFVRRHRRRDYFR